MIRAIFVIHFTILFFISGNMQAQLIIAHRGASADAPENTLAAFNLAWERGADGIEGDFYLSEDGEIVCIHDARTKRLTGGEVDLVVAETTFADLRKLDVGSWKDAKYKGERIPTLKEVLTTIPAGKRIFIEIKCGPEIVPILKKQLAGFPQLKPEQISIICFQKSVVVACRKQLPELTVNWLNSYKQDKSTGEWSPSAESVMTSLKECGASGLGTNAQPKLVTPAFVKQLRNHGYGFHCWTIDDVEMAKRFQALGVDSITTNRPAFIRSGITGKSNAKPKE